MSEHSGCNHLICTEVSEFHHLCCQVPVFYHFLVIEWLSQLLISKQRVQRNCVDNSTYLFVFHKKNFLCLPPTYKFTLFYLIQAGLLSLLTKLTKLGYALFVLRSFVNSPTCLCKSLSYLLSHSLNLSHLSASSFASLILLVVDLWVFCWIFVYVLSSIFHHAKDVICFYSFFLMQS